MEKNIRLKVLEWLLNWMYWTGYEFMWESTRT